MCETCGLVRDASGTVVTGAYYEREYEVEDSDHVFHTPAGPVYRSMLLADWCEETFRSSRLDVRGWRVLEVGAGRGHLLAELARRHPDASWEGHERGAVAAADARRAGLDVVGGALDGLPEEAYDLVVAVAVLEHVPSPTAFLGQLRRRLRPTGWLLLVQPAQDVPSHDIFFVDHTFHFCRTHLRAYAAKCGFNEHVSRLGYAWMPNFSLHFWQRTEAATSWSWAGGPSAPATEAAGARLLADLARLERAATALRDAGRRFGVFGVHEAYAVVRTYSRVEEIGVTCGLDDRPDVRRREALPFPVITPEACRAAGVEDVFLTMSRVHYPWAIARLSSLGVRAHPVFSEGA